MKVLVTGDSGLIGSHLVDLLVEQGHDVSGISRTLKHPNHKAKRYLVDLKDKDLTRQAIEQIKPEVIFHLAANAAEGRGQFSPIEVTENNYQPFFNVITPAINNGLKRFVFSSSIAAYGDAPIPCKESDTPQPEDIYGVAKYAIERSIRILSDVHGFEYSIARMHNVVGSRQNANDPYRNVATLFMNQLLKGEQYYIYGDGNMSRQFSYVHDVVDVLAKLGFGEQTKNEIINIGSDREVSIQELSNIIQSIARIHVEPRYLSLRPNEVERFVCDHTKCKELGYKDTPLDDALVEAWDYMVEIGDQELKFEAPEIDSDKYPKNWK